MPRPKYTQRSQPNRRRLGIARFNPNPPPTVVKGFTAAGGTTSFADLNGEYEPSGPNLYYGNGVIATMTWVDGDGWTWWNGKPGEAGTAIATHPSAPGNVPPPLTGWEAFTGTGTRPTITIDP